MVRSGTRKLCTTQTQRTPAKIKSSIRNKESNEKTNNEEEIMKKKEEGKEGSKKSKAHLSCSMGEIPFTVKILV